MSLPLRPFQRIRFLFSATNEHGVHSPFVFNYITKCLYAGNKIGKDKSAAILYKSIVYFGTKRLGLFGDFARLRADFAHSFPQLQFEQTPYDIIAMDIRAAERLFEKTIKSSIHNDTLLLVDSIHLYKGNMAVWERLKKHPLTTVTIDLYYCGLIFFRREQARQDFKIRI